MSAEQAATAPAQPQIGRYRSSPYEVHPEDLQDWTFQDNDAEELKTLGRIAAERAKVLVQAQETVLRNIQAKLLVDPDAALAEANYHAQVKAQQQQQQLLEKSASAPVLGHHAGASAIARKAAAREERAAQFQMRRQALINEEQQSRHRLVEQQDFASARFAERQKVAQLERHRKLRNLYSSRQEVQKINREMERAQERARDDYYLREEMRATEKERSMHPTRSLAWSLGLAGSASIAGAVSPAGGSPTGSSSPALVTRGGQAGGRNRGTMPMGWSVEGQGAAEQGDDIYSSTLKSHAVYDGTMQTWQQYVWENDVRAEHYWRKMVVNEGDRAALRGGAGGTPGSRETIKRHPRDFRLPEFLLEERKDRNSRKAQQRRSSIRQMGRRRSSAIAFDTMLSPQPSTAGADGLSPRASARFRSPTAAARASTLRKSPTSIGPTTITTVKHTEVMPPPEAWALPKLPDKPTPAVSSSVEQVEFSTRPFSGGATELPEVRSAQGPRPERSVTIQQPSSAAGSTTSEGLPEVQPMLARSSTEGRAKSKTSPNEGDRDMPRGSKSRASGGGFNPRRSKARFAEADLISIRTAIFKNEHRTSLRASDLRKMREYAAASSPDNMVSFTRTT